MGEIIQFRPRPKTEAEKAQIMEDLMSEYKELLNNLAVFTTPTSEVKYYAEEMKKLLPMIFGNNTKEVKNEYFEELCNIAEYFYGALAQFCEEHEEETNKFKYFSHA